MTTLPEPEQPTKFPLLWLIIVILGISIFIGLFFLVSLFRKAQPSQKTPTPVPSPSVASTSSIIRDPWTVAFVKDGTLFIQSSLNTPQETLKLTDGKPLVYDSNVNAGLVFSSSGRFLYWHHRPSRTVRVFDRSKRTLHSLSTKTRSLPIRFESGDRIALTDETLTNLQIVDLTTSTVTSSIPLKGAALLSVSPRRDTLLLRRDGLGQQRTHTFSINSLNSSEEKTIFISRAALSTPPPIWLPDDQGVLFFDDKTITLAPTHDGGPKSLVQATGKIISASPVSPESTQLLAIQKATAAALAIFDIGEKTLRPIIGLPDFPAGSTPPVIGAASQDLFWLITPIQKQMGFMVWHVDTHTNQKQLLLENIDRFALFRVREQ